MRSLIEDSKKFVDMIQTRVKYLRDCFPQRLETLQNLGSRGRQVSKLY